MSRCACALLVVMSLVSPAPAQAWGPEGHRAAVAIASERLCGAAAAELERIAGEMSLEALSTWPDGIRDDPAWSHTRDWHYINIEDDASFSALVEGVPGHGQLLRAIRSNLALLADEDAPDARRREALGFVLHLLADLHQPLHVGRAGDRGGNRIELSFEGRTTNLHRLWDGVLLRSAGLRADDYQRSLGPLVALGAVSWERGALEDWAEESRQLRPWVYDFDARRRVPVISRRYAETGRQLTSLRLAQAGVRTAWVLNEIWCSDRNGDTPHLSK
jgi:hypothetical protein